MSRRLIAPSLVLLVALVLAVVAFTGDDTPALIDTAPPATASQAENTPSSERMASMRVDPDAGLSVGDPDAPLVMVTFESFGCLWCGVFHRETLPMVMEDWVETGRLRIETRLLPYEPRATAGAGSPQQPHSKIDTGSSPSTSTRSSPAPTLRRSAEI